MARDVLPNQLAELGARVDVVPAYRTLPPVDLAERAGIALPEADWITFTSSSTVTNTVEAAGASALAAVKIASIGPITSFDLA